MNIDFTTLPFDEAIVFFRKKLNMPTATWTDIQKEMHDRAFVVSGAMQEDLIQDLKDSVIDAVVKSGTIQAFRKEFNAIVARHGWSFKGTQGFRTGVIFHTNMRVAYTKGQYEQILSTKKQRPFMRYIGGLSENPRELHLKWDGTVLPIDDPWWSTHMPPNGWGCKCQVVSHSQAELTRDGREVKPAPDDGTFKWKNPKTKKIETIPKGIDPGWDYNPGATGFKDV